MIWASLLKIPENFSTSNCKLLKNLVKIGIFEKFSLKISLKKWQGCIATKFITRSFVISKLLMIYWRISRLCFKLMDVALIQKHFSSGTTRTLDHIRQIIDILSSFPSKVRSKSLRPRGFQCVECAIPKRFLLLLLLLSIDYFFVTFEKTTHLAASC